MIPSEERRRCHDEKMGCRLGTLAVCACPYVLWGMYGDAACIEAGGLLLTSDYWGVVHGADPGEAARDEEGMAVAARLGWNMAWMVRVLRETKLPAPEAARRPMMNFIR